MSAQGRIESVEVLRVRLERVEREAASRQRQLERYAADLREVFKRERARAQELELARRAGMDVVRRPQLEFGFLLHDVGKVAVPDAILFKTGPLTDEEYSLIAQHPVTGAEILRDVTFLGDGIDVVRHHHERWDGQGYPDRLQGEEIPLSARVFAVADTLDALTTDRPYRPAVSWDVARDIILDAAGTQFDPAVVAAYETIADPVFAALAESVR